MTSNHLRQLKDLRHFTVVCADALRGKLAGIAFDPANWTIRHLVVADRSKSRGPLIVPVRFFRSIDDERRELRFDVADEVLLSPGGYRIDPLADSKLFDAVALIGQTVDGCDGPAGRIDDLLLNIDIWQLRYLVVETDSRRVLTDIEWCSSFDGGSGRVTLDLPAAAVAGAPRYQGLDELCTGYEEALYRHYTSRTYAAEGGIATR